MIALKLPEREFKGLLNIVRQRIKHVYGINLLGTALKNQLLFKLLKHNYGAYFQVKVNI